MITIVKVVFRCPVAWWIEPCCCKSLSLNPLLYPLLAKENKRSTASEHPRTSGTPEKGTPSPSDTSHDSRLTSTVFPKRNDWNAISGLSTWWPSMRVYESDRLSGRAIASQTAQQGISIVGTRYRFHIGFRRWLMINSGYSEDSKLMLDSWRKGLMKTMINSWSFIVVSEKNVIPSQLPSYLNKW